MTRIPKPVRRSRSQAQRTLAEIRDHLGVRQSELGRWLGLTQAAVLKTERAADPQVRTLQRYVEALGAAAGARGRLRLQAVIGSDSYEIVLPAGDLPVTATQERFNGAAGSSTARTTWRLRAWDDAFLEHEFLGQGIIAISDDEIGSLEEWPTTDSEVTERLRTAFPERSPQAIGTFLRYWRDFRVDMQPGDAVVVPMSGRRAAIGTVTGPYSYEPGEPKKLRHRRTVDWRGVIERDALDDDLRKVVNAPGTICRVRAPDAASRLEAISSADQRETDT